MKANPKKSTKIHLTSKEKSELLIESIATVILLILLNLAVYMILIQIIETNRSVDDMLFNIKASIYNTFYSQHSSSLKLPLLIFMMTIDLIVLYWRLIRRYKQMQQRHIISELHYISNGHLDHRIPFELGGDAGRLIDSINVLVDSTVAAIEEERRIEQTKDELITNVSHDIRTPLTSVIGYLGLIEEKQYKSEEDLLKYTHTAYIKSKQMKVLVDDLFEYTKVRQSNSPLNIITFDIQQLIEQLVVDYEWPASQQKMEIDFQSPYEHISMTGDPEKLVRVFDNLLSNALKYGVGGSEIIITIKKTNTDVYISIKNNGPEIPNESLEHLFDRFYRVESSRSKQTGGTGLGLAIAQSIINLHEGSINTTSTNGWTSFNIVLPLQLKQKI